MYQSNINMINNYSYMVNKNKEKSVEHKLYLFILKYIQFLVNFK